MEEINNKVWPNSYGIWDSDQNIVCRCANCGSYKIQAEKVNLDNLYLRLYVNTNPTMAIADTYIEPNDEGYKPIKLIRMAGSHKFEFIGPADIYGYCVTSGDEVVRTERFTSAPFCLPDAGGTIEITLI